VTVLMSVFNGQRYLREAVESILGQTFEDFELLVVNDGSTDASRAILDSYRDPRLRIVEHATNLGLSRSLNRGIAQARGRYVARLDADDVAEPDRLQRQVDFLDRHPDVVLLGSCYTVIDEDGHRIGQRWVPVDDLEIRWMLEFCNAFAHSAVMLRRDALAGEAVVYDESLVYAMDYDLWTRLAGRGRLANLDACLVRWRAAPGSLTSRLGDRTERFERVVASLRERLRWPVEDAGENERKAGLLCAIVAGATPDASIDEAEAAIGTLLDLHADFCRRHDVPAATRGVLRTGLVRHAARVLCWMGHQYPDHRTRSDARRALAAAGRLHPASLLTSEGLRLALKILGGPPVVFLLRRLASRREARATRKDVDAGTV
jgi:hypothetical protein